MAYGDYKDLTKRKASDKIFRDIAKNPKYDGYQHGLASIVYKFFDKKLRVVVLKMRIFHTKNYKNELLENSRKEKYNHLLF